MFPIPPDQEKECHSQQATASKETSSSAKPFPTSTIINHRKRRLLQHGEAVAALATQSANRIEENNLLNQAARRRAYLTDVMNLARNRGLVALVTKDEYGNEWLEIRPSVASYRVPKYNYPTHLSRLLVDSSLQYFVEVLGHCVRKGSLYKDVALCLNETEVDWILCAMDGGYVVCQGIESVYKQVPDLHMKNAQELGLCDNMYLTLPDYRYRSHDCLKWIDQRMGPRCSACCQWTNMSSDDEYSGVPIDLRCNPQQHEH